MVRFQYLINTDDSMVIHYLKVFTFLSKEEIEEIAEKQNQNPESRIAQHALAREIITDIHGEREYKHALSISEALFSEKVKELKSDDILNSLKGVPSLNITVDKNIIDFLVDNSICPSKREARELVNAGAISINNEKIKDLTYQITLNDTIENKVMIIKKGKKNYYLGKID